MLNFASPEKFKLNSKINSEHRVRCEWNFNDFIAIEDYGSYKTKTSNAYPASYQKNTGYDTGKSEIFFDGITKLVEYTGSGTTLTVPTGHGITVGMRVEGKGIQAETYVSATPTATTLTISKSMNQTVSSATEGSFYNYDVQFDKDRINYTPLISIFDKNRPDPGIVNLVSNTRYGSPILDIEKLKASNFGNTTGNTREDRIYPIYKNSTYRYWNSIRKILKDYIPETVGISSSTPSSGIYSIDHAAPFVVYEESFFTNKIVIKTQKYNGFPKEFKIEVLSGNNPGYTGSNQTSWTLAYTGTTTDLQDGILEIYYNGTAWTTTPQYLTEFIGNPTKAVKIHGLRFSITGMSAANVSAEVIELSPRLSADITAYTMSFDKVTTLNNTTYGIPVAGLVSTTGSLTISNVDKIFSTRNPDSILSGLLYEGTKIIFEQIVDSVAIPLGTLYAVSWAENSDFTTNVELEDFLFFLKSLKSPDIAIANTTGIEASVATLILLDNAGITNYKFEKQSLTSRDDFVFDFFYSNNSSTVAKSLEDIATSAQYAIFVDVNNNINVVTKEKFSQVVSGLGTDYWLVGSEDWADEEEETYLDGEYVSNISSINESISLPITEATVNYIGNGVVKDSKGVLKAYATGDDFNPLFNPSLVTRDFSYGITELWSIEDGDSEQLSTLYAMAYIKDISATRPSSLTDAMATPIRGQDENSVARQLYFSTLDKSYLEIILDEEYATLFLMGKKYEGHVLIDSELIKYRGLILDVLDDRDPSRSGSSVVFNEAEFAQIKSNVSTGSSVFCKGLLVDMNFEVESIIDVLQSGEKDYFFKSDGRGKNNTIISQHKSQTNPELLTREFTTKMYASSFNSNIKATGTIVTKSVKINSPKINETKNERRVSYPGYLKMSGPKEDWKKNEDAKLGDTTDIDSKLPIDNFGERFLTGFYQPINFSPERISTRMRLLSKPKKEVFTEVLDDTKKFFLNRGIAGICFRLNHSTSGTTGYFLEIEDVGNLREKQLEENNFKNLRLYRVSKKNNKFVPKLLGGAWVNTSAVASESLDIGNANINNGNSFTGVTDLIITIEETPKNFIYRVFWEDKKVLTVKESKEDAINKKSNNIGLFVRSNSEAMFEHLMAASTNRNGMYPVSTIFSKNSPYMKLQKAASRGLLPSGLSEGLVGKNMTKFFYEDFGNMVREVGKFSVKFDTPAIYSQIVSLQEVNPDYYVANYSASSYGADFWVFNTANSNINLSSSTNLPLIISGVAINSISPGEITLSQYITKRLGEDNEDISLLSKNIKKFGSNNITISGEYINSLSQAENILNWILQNSIEPKKIINCDIFPNPLLELGDKVRIFYPDLGYSYAQQGDKVYYVHSISYNVSTDGPKMSISVREV